MDRTNRYIGFDCSLYKCISVQILFFFFLITKFYIEVCLSICIKKCFLFFVFLICFNTLEKDDTKPNMYVTSGKDLWITTVDTSSFRIQHGSWVCLVDIDTVLAVNPSLVVKEPPRYPDVLWLIHYLRFSTALNYISVKIQQNSVTYVQDVQ